MIVNPICPDSTGKHAERQASNACESNGEQQSPSSNLLSDKAKQARPGITNSTLRANGIVADLDTTIKSLPVKFTIPYFTFEGSDDGRSETRDESAPETQFCRKRLGQERDGQKYSQPKGTRPHAYFPKDLMQALEQKRYLIVTEGEFKALSLVEAGFPAVGIGGLYNFQSGNELLPEFTEFFDACSRNNITLTNIYFLGDADTSINPAFSQAAVRMREMLQRYGIPMHLPRMPLKDVSTAKGIDDAKQDMECGKFEEYMAGLLANSVPLDGDTTGEELAESLFNRDEDDFRKLASEAPDDKKQWLVRRLADLANHVSSEMGDELGVLAKEIGLVKKISQFKTERKRQKEKFEREMAEKKKNSRPVVQILYCPESKPKYVYQTASGEYTRVDRLGASNHLVEMGYSRKAVSDTVLPEADSVITAGEQFPFDYVGAIGGRQAGTDTGNGMRLLITRGPDLLQPEPGNWSNLRSFLETKFNGCSGSSPESTITTEQLPYCLGWLKHACHALYEQHGRFTPSQALVLCGPRDAGKNVIQNIVTHTLGNRMANPFLFMEGNSSFNGELLGAEHWMVADEQTSTKNRDKERLKACIKQTSVNASMSINPKHNKPINIEFFRRLTISLNDEPEALRVLPSLSSDFEDKLMILHVLPGIPFGPGQRFSGYDSWWSQIKKELPAFVHYLLKEHVIAPEHFNQRYGIMSFKEPQILHRIQEQSADGRLFEMIDEYALYEDRGFQGGAKDLFYHLQHQGMDRELALIGCTSPIKLGQMLKRLIKLKPERFGAVKIVDGITKYRILPSQASSAAGETESLTEEELAQAA